MCPYGLFRVWKDVLSPVLGTDVHVRGKQNESHAKPSMLMGLVVSGEGDLVIQILTYAFEVTVSGQATPIDY
jgi:hypothetical protein